MQDDFFRGLSAALGAAPSTAAADGVLRLMQATDPEVSRWQLPNAIKAAAPNPATPIFQVLDQWKLLERDVLADAVALHASLRANMPLLAAWRRHPQARAMAESERGEQVLRMILQDSNKEQQRETVLARLLPELPWAQRSLDRALRLCVEANSLRGSNRHECMGLLLDAGADPTWCPPGENKSRATAWILAHAHMREPHHAEKLLRHLSGSRFWPQVVALVEKGKSMPHTISALAHCKGLEAALDKTPDRWWDGDPYGLLDLVIKRAHREPALLIAICDRARQQGVLQGLQPAGLPRVFMALHASCGKESSKAAARMEFWKGQAPRLAYLWQDPSPWQDLCKLAHDFEMSHGDQSTIEQRESFAQAAALTISTQPAQAQARRRTL